MSDRSGTAPGRSRPLVGTVGARPRPGAPAGAVEIAYRAGDYSTFLRDLLDHVRSETLRGGVHAGERPLARLDTAAYQEWTVGLFKAWAEVGDILSFYQERIANEGFLATAREERSIREIVRLIDHVPAPGIGSTTRLAYKLLELPGTPDEVVIPVRASVTSVPERSELPQTWETVEALNARVEWNALRPRIPSVEIRPGVAPGATALDLEGVDLGLGPQSPLLIELDTGDGVEPVFRRIATLEEIDAETTGAPALTRVTFDRPLRAASQAAAGLRRVWSLQRELGLFGRDAPAWSDLDEEAKARHARPLGGVIVSGPAGGWASLNAGLPEGGALCVLAAADGSLYAGTSDGIFRCVDGQRWRRSGADLVGHEIVTLATDGRQQIFAGTAGNGVLRSADGEAWEVLLGEAIREPMVALARRPVPRSGRLPLSPVRAVLPAGDRVFAGTDHGVFVFVDSADTWQATSRGLPGWAPGTGRAGVVVQTLVRGEDQGELFAGTDKGVFRSVDLGRTWKPRNAGLPGFDPDTGSAEASILALHAGRGRRARMLLAGTGSGVFRSLDGGERWEAASLGLPGTDLDTGLCETPVTALVLATDPATLEARCFAATPEGLFESDDAGVYWLAVSGEVASRPVAALVQSPAGALVASVPLGGFDRERWPRFRIRDGELDLTDAAPGIEEGDWLVLEDGGDGAGAEPLIEIVRCARVRQLVRQDFTLEEVVTRVVADRALASEARFDLRSTRVLAGARALRVPSGHRARLQPLARELIELAPEQALFPFPGRRSVIVDGRPLRVRFDGPRTLCTDDGAEHVVGDGDEPQVLRCRPVAGDRMRLRVRLRGDVQGELTVARADMAWRPARAGDDAVAQGVTATWMDSAAGATGPALAVYPALEHCLDPATVRILANVAEATQGRTVYRDVIGSGDATRAHQRFPISAPPLSYLKTASARGWTSTLEIRVNGVRWREVDSLHDAGPRDRVYMVREAIDGVATAIFGDGTHGARLPSGRENVVALYRSGFWREGVNRGRLTVAETKPIGVDGVTNPLRAAAGAAPETPEQTRRRAPVMLRTLGRIVSLRDYEDFCTAYPGVAQARVARLATDRGTVVHVTVATDDGSLLQQGDELHAALLASVAAARSDTGPLAIDSCRRVPFDVAAVVRFDDRRRASDVERAVRDALLAACGHDRATFGARLTASDLVRRIGDVPGVVSVMLERFHRAAAAPSTEAYLHAAPARWDASSRTFIGAELLELRRPGGLALDMVPAR